jgi:chlorite dismutase
MPEVNVHERAGVQAAAMPAVPLTVEGASVLHQMFRMRWPAWKALAPAERQEIAGEAAQVLAGWETDGERQSALYSLLGHKGDFLVVHFRRSFDELNEAERRLSSLRLSDYLEQTSSYLSVVELGLYDSSVRLFRSLAERGIQPDTAEWNAEIDEALAQHRKAMASRLWPSIPPSRYVCFYPMDRKRAEARNWYQLPMAERQRLMHEHGMVGRKYAGEVKQIITGSIGFDDWEWAVDLFSDDPLQFKKIIYEMRFDEASAVYALFGSFYLGIRLPASRLVDWSEFRSAGENP